MTADGGQDPPTVRRSYSRAEAEADRANLLVLKRSSSFWSLAIVAVAGLAAVRWLPHPAYALWTGGICGVLNSVWTMRSGERLLEKRGVGGFVLSSFVRIGVFGIVPVAFAALGPWWSMGWYFAGFFLPLAMFALGAYRVSGAK